MSPGRCVCVWVAAGFSAAASTGLAETDPDLARFRLPPGFVIERVAGPPDIQYGMCAAFDERGRLFVTESSGSNDPGPKLVEKPECRIRLLEDRDTDGRFETSHVFADRLSLPMGVLFHQGSLFVASPPDLLRFEDENDDGVADRRTVLLTGWNVLNTASLHGPFLGPDGWLYLTHGRHGYKIRTKEGQTIEGLASRIYRCRPDGTRLERISGGGFDNPVELAFTPGGEMFCTMTYIVDPARELSPAGMRDALIHVVDGAVFPKYHDCVSEFRLTGELMPPMLRLARVSPSGFVRYRGANFGPRYQGAYFTNQFNTHAVRCHRLTENGATYIASDEEFLSCDDPDFHPSDIVEDADGSLIVVDTGGWYLQACPLSRIAKPDVRGAIYRIRRADAAPAADPRGRSLGLERLDPAELIAYLDDDRFAVRDRAVELLVSKRLAAVPAMLDAAADPDGSPRLRRSRVWCLARIAMDAAAQSNTAAHSDTAASADHNIRAHLHRALQDPDAQVRLAATHSVSLLGDAGAVDALIDLLRSDPSAHVQREAAAALGRIGRPRSTAALFEALGREPQPGRFLEHAITFSLISVAPPDELSRMLETGPPLARQAALLALEQVHPAALQRHQVAPLLRLGHAGLRQAVLWVLARRPDWAGDVTGDLERWITSSNLDPDHMPALRDALVALSANPNVQRLVADLLARPLLATDRRSLLMEVIALYPGTSLPQEWETAVGRGLRDALPELRSSAIATIRLRGLSQWDDALLAIADRADEPEELRVAALAAAIQRQPALTAQRFEILIARLDASAPALLRAAAADTLSRAPLDDAQRRRLLPHLASGDPLITGALLQSLSKSRDPELGRDLVQVLSNASTQRDPLSRERLDQVLTSYPASVREAARPLYDRALAVEQEQLGTMQRLMPLTQGGNPLRGQEVFFSQAAACGSCHRVGDAGGRVGPDLTSIGSIRAGRDLLESILFPSASMAQGYEPFVIETQDGFTFEGVIIRQTADTITLRSISNAEIRIERRSIVNLQPSTQSIMPQGFERALTPQQLQDLLAFLQSLK